MFIKNMNISSMPISTWICSAENAHVPTPTESVKPVNTIALPAWVIAASIASVNAVPLFALRQKTTEQINPVVHTLAHAQRHHRQRQVFRPMSIHSISVCARTDTNASGSTMQITILTERKPATKQDHRTKT